MSGKLRLADMPRLATSLVTTAGPEVDVTLEFVMHQGFPTVAGQVRGVLPVQCQRCMGTYDLPVEADFHLGVVQTEEQAASLPTNLEPLFVTDDEIRLVEVIEDELILALPIVPLHEDGTCKPKPVEQPMPAVAPERENPFGALKKLKTPDSSS